MSKLPLRLQIAIALLILGVAIVIGAITSYYNQHTLETELKSRAETQRVLLLDLAEVIDKNGADSTVKSVVSDCSKRGEFDSLIANTASLQKKELVTLQSLIESCGNYFPLTKAIMVAQLEREFRVYEEYVRLIELLDADNLHVYQMDSWSELIELELKRSDLLKEQVDIQAEIVSLLIKGNSVASKLVQEQITDAQSVNVFLVSHDTRIDEIRASLTP